MPLLFFDLDNTLLDRAGAFRGWAQAFLAGLGVPEDLDWLVGMDADGLTSRWDLADAIRDRYLLDVSVLDLVETLTAELADRARIDPMDACALRIASDAGWIPVVVSNGEERIQTERIRRSGLDQYVAASVIAGEVDVSKPNPRIFEIAAARVGGSLDGAWIIGDGPEEDIGGARSLGLRSVWLHRGRAWSGTGYEPTRSADCVIAAVAAVLDASEPPHALRVPAPRSPRLDSNPPGSSTSGQRRVPPPDAAGTTYGREPARPEPAFGPRAPGPAPDRQPEPGYGRVPLAGYVREPVHLASAPRGPEPRARGAARPAGGYDRDAPVSGVPAAGYDRDAPVSARPAAGYDRDGPARVRGAARPEPISARPEPGTARGAARPAGGYDREERPGPVYGRPTGAYGQATPAGGPDPTDGYGREGYPPQGGEGYPPQGGEGYPPQGGEGYPPQGGEGYPPQGGEGYPPQRGRSRPQPPRGRAEARGEPARGREDYASTGYAAGTGYGRAGSRAGTGYGRDGDGHADREPDQDHERGGRARREPDGRGRARAAARPVSPAAGQWRSNRG